MAELAEHVSQLSHTECVAACSAMLALRGAWVLMVTQCVGVSAASRVCRRELRRVY